jgi:endoglucanase
MMSMNAFSKMPDAFTMNEQIGRGINMGNMFESPRGRFWGVLEVGYFDLIKEAGFDSVRLPVRWSDYTAADAPYLIEPDFLAQIDTVIEEALKRHLIVILNIHHYKEFMESPEEHTDRFLSIWRQLSVHFKTAPQALCFEVLNEPTGNVTADIWNRVQNDAIQLIRKTNPQRTIFVAPVGWNRIHDLKKLELPATDRNLIASVHFYEPFQFTHQGAGWVNKIIPVGTPWAGTDEEQAALQVDLDEAVRWSNEHHIPINVGEFGVYSKADMESRVRWTSFLRREIEKRGFSWNYWEFCSSFGIYDPDAASWRIELLNALMLQK